MITSSVLVTLTRLGFVGALLSGEVRDVNGKPVAGVRVVLSAGQTNARAVPIPAEATSDTKGSFQLARPEGEMLRVIAERGVLWGYKRGSGLGIVDLYRAGGT